MSFDDRGTQKSSRSKKRRVRLPGLPSSLVRSPARPREFVNSRSKFAELGLPFSVSMALHPFQPGLAGPSLSPFPLPSFSRRSVSPFHLEESELKVGGQYHRPLHPASFPPPLPRAGPCHCSHTSHHRRLPREELGRSLSPPVRTIMKDINYNFISNYR